jgi:hypothetical protein
MTFLLFLLSIAALEYILRGQKSSAIPGKPESFPDLDPNLSTTTSDLLAIGRALTPVVPTESPVAPQQSSDSEHLRDPVKNVSGLGSS